MESGGQEKVQTQVKDRKEIGKTHVHFREASEGGGW